jgi:hypothetical protein
VPRPVLERVIQPLQSSCRHRQRLALAGHEDHLEHRRNQPQRERIEGNIEEAANIAKTGRAILGWKTLREVEPIIGFLLTRELNPILKAANDEERISLQTFHPTWFVKYCYSLFGRSEAIALLEEDVNSPPTYIRLNALRASEDKIR